MKTLQCNKSFICSICHGCLTHCTGHKTMRTNPHNVETINVIGRKEVNPDTWQCRQLFAINRKGDMVPFGRTDGPKLRESDL